MVTKNYISKCLSFGRLQLLAAFLVFISFELVASSNLQAFKSAPEGLVNAGYLEASPSPQYNQLKAVLGQIALPAGANYLASYAMALGTSYKFGYPYVEAILPAAAFGWSLAQQDSISGVALQAGASLSVMLAGRYYPEFITSLGWGIFSAQLTSLLIPEGMNLWNADARTFQLEKVPEGFRIELSKQQGKTASTALEISWLQSSLSDKQNAETEAGSVLNRLGLAGKQQGFSGIILYPEGSSKSAPLTLKYQWRLPDGTKDTKQNVIILAGTEHLSWWTDSLITDNRFMTEVKGMVSFGDPLSPDILARLANYETGEIAASPEESWNTLHQAHTPVGLLSSPGHFDIWLYPGDTSLFSLYRPTMPEFILVGAHEWKHNLSDLAEHITYPVFSSWARLPFRLARFAAVTSLSYLGAKHGYEKAKQWQDEEKTKLEIRLEKKEGENKGVREAQDVIEEPDIGEKQDIGGKQDVRKKKTSGKRKRVEREKRRLEKESLLEEEWLLEEKRRLEEERLLDEERWSEEKRRLEEERLLDEERWLEDKRRLEEERLLDEERWLEEKRRLEEELLLERKKRLDSGAGSDRASVSDSGGGPSSASELWEYLSKRSRDSRWDLLRRVRDEFNQLEEQWTNNRSWRTRMDTVGSDADKAIYLDYEAQMGDHPRGFAGYTKRMRSYLSSKDISRLASGFLEWIAEVSPESLNFEFNKAVFDYNEVVNLRHWERGLVFQNTPDFKGYFGQICNALDDNEAMNGGYREAIGIERDYLEQLINLASSKGITLSMWGEVGVPNLYFQ